MFRRWIYYMFSTLSEQMKKKSVLRIMKYVLISMFISAIRLNEKNTNKLFILNYFLLKLLVTSELNLNENGNLRVKKRLKYNHAN